MERDVQEAESIHLHCALKVLVEEMFPDLHFNTPLSVSLSVTQGLWASSGRSTFVMQSK